MQRVVWPQRRLFLSLAVPLVRGLILLCGLMSVVGCASQPLDPGVPDKADLLTDLVSPLGQRSEGATSLEVPQDGAIYVVDVTQKQLLQTSAVKTGDVLKLSWGGVNVIGRLPSKSNFRPLHERQVVRYVAGHQYRVYYKPGEDAPPATADEGSPLTRPYEVRERTLNPLEQHQQNR